MLGRSDRAWNGQKLPLELSFMGMPTGKLLVSWDAEQLTFSQTSTTSWSTVVPPWPKLLGLTFYIQFWNLNSAANTAGISVTGAKIVIGR